MTIRRAAAYLYTVLTGAVIVFQLALAGGASWGSYAMGGTVSGSFPAALRVMAVVQAILLAVFAAVVLSRAGIALARWSRLSRWAAWIVAAFGLAGLVLNLITPSSGERMVWAPVAFLMLASSLTVAIEKPLREKEVAG